MAVSFASLVSQIVGGRHEHPPIVLSDQQFADLLAGLAVGGSGSSMVLSTSSSDPTALASPITFTRVDENGKQQFCVRFKSGAVQVLATEPA